MALRSADRRGLPALVIGTLLVALVVGVAVLVALAIDRGRGVTPASDAAPAPSFSFDSTASPSASASPPPAVTHPQADERFLAVGEGVMWRATAGTCGSAAPVVERSDDDGAEWVDVTPTYRDIAGVRDLAPFADTQADLVADMGEDCETQALRTFTSGEFWSPYEDLLARSTYRVDGTVFDDGERYDAPCDEPWGLRATRELSSLICDGTASAYRDGEWDELADGVIAVAVHDGAVFAASVVTECEGVQVTRHAEETDVVGCVTTADAEAPAALAVTDDAVWLWSGDSLDALDR